jgi:hypothetical protein
MGVIFLNGAKLATSFLEMTQCPCKVIVMYENFGVKKKGNRMSIYHIEKQAQQARQVQQVQAQAQQVQAQAQQAQPSAKPILCKK